MGRLTYIGFLVCFLCMVTHAGDEFRLFEAQGRPIEARVVDADMQRGLVVLELRSGQRKKVKAAIFSDVDQQYIQDWALVKDFMSLRLSIEAEKKIVDKKKEMLGSQGAIRRDSVVFRYDIEISNRSSSEFIGLRLEYNIFYEQEELVNSGNSLKNHTIVGEKSLKPLTANRNVVVPSKQYSVYNQRLAGGYDEYVGGQPTNQSGKSKGIWVRLRMKTASGLTAMKEFCMPKTAREQYVWKSGS